MIMSVAHSIELLLDDDSDARIRANWESLDAAGLRTPASIVAPTVRPHCTLLAGSSISGSDGGMSAVAQRLPICAVVGPPILFDSPSGLTLAAILVPSADLLAVHATAHRLCGGGVADLDPHCTPGAWTPHVTLARRVPADAVADALARLGGPIAAQVTAVRRWDGDSRTETVVSGRGC